MQVSEGVNSCTSNDSLPRNINQAYNQRRTSSVECDKTSSLDPHNSCVLLCKEETKNINTAFIREVNIAPELEVECANEKQLDDVVKFCTNENFGIFEVDPKYNLGDFYVTTSKYQHLLLLKTGSGGKKGKLPSCQFFEQLQFNSMNMIHQPRLIHLSPSPNQLQQVHPQLAH